MTGEISFQAANAKNDANLKVKGGFIFYKNVCSKNQ